MIRLHHLNQSRSIRILWLLEEIGAPYDIEFYRRDSKTHFAPESLKAIHPLGKSPVIELDGKVVAESGAITEILIERFAPHLAPEKHTADYLDYLQWLHFSESSAMLPPLLKIFAQREAATLSFLPGYAQQECEKVFGYLDQQLENRTFLVGEKLSGADFMMLFVAELVERLEKPETYANIQRYLVTLKNLDSWKSAQAREAGFYG
ncbi:glutathione S-transferase family protein [Pseudomonas capsici]|uniref:glutathione S-transferase family protein n=1 Tax=Pseudomonas capsici TaxID=2810614 RepID=UPI000E3E3F33|nr:MULTISPECIES: glutathione S-transferase [Pseudomonas]MBX8608798.1 glutathione S-transferase [Pseudomonas cichorii]MCV4263366.1 glutathione S-transferase [Pseudomonas capsici]GFM57945.1 glutathione S-transferase [Pseudomonas cichorii]GFM60308.1 glutathione S-transferase [Pseudomonas cichorii]